MAPERLPPFLLRPGPFSGRWEPDRLGGDLLAQSDPGPPPDELARRTMNLAEFARAAWPVLHGSNPLACGWYMEAICQHLEAVTDGHVRNLVITLPPRFAKSTLVSVLWPCWEWTFRPWTSWLFVAYGAELSERDNLRAKQLIRSSWYQARFGDRFALPRTRDRKDTATKFENTCGGYRIATSVGGVITGEGADVIVVDDPLKAEDANSEARRSAVNRWWSETMSSRLNDPRTGAKVIVMQRLHEDDLTGYFLQSEAHYEHLVMPMEYELPLDDQGHLLPKPATALGWSDPRTEPGELLCPERVGPDEAARLRAEVGEYAWAAQYQQRPAPRGGSMFRTDKLDVVTAIPPTARLIRCRAWDRAATANGGAFTAGVLMSLDVGTRTIYIEDIVRGRWSSGEREAIMLQTARADGRYVSVLLEQEPGSAGLDSARATAGTLAEFAVQAIRATSPKEVRAQALASQLALGTVKLVAGSWLHAFRQELASFPHGHYCDQVDACSLGFNWLVLRQLRRAGTPVASPPVPRFQPR